MTGKRGRKKSRQIFSSLEPILECIPNFSEGRDLKIIQAITDRVKSVPGVQLLHVDSGKDANRTVVSFAGQPSQVGEAAFLAIATAGELINMEKHYGAHPRLGATDVCPLIPLNGSTITTANEVAKALGYRVGNELGISVYFYEWSQPDPLRRQLSQIRSGEYEGLASKIMLPNWTPDAGPARFDSRRGATVVGARGVLIAFNVHLNTQKVFIAEAIAAEIRESGQILRDGLGVKSKAVKGLDGTTLRQPGTLKAVKAIGWFIEEYGLAQVSMNLTDITQTPMHIAFEEVRKKAEARGIEVLGSELVGLAPLSAFVQAGIYFLGQEGKPFDRSETELVEVAVNRLGLAHFTPFIIGERILDYRISPKKG